MNEQTTTERRWTTLGLPLSCPGITWAATGVVALFYLLTMCRDMSFYDSAELALVAVVGGLSHPPGHPLYTMAGWLLTRLPGEPLLWLNALSALPVALTIVPLTSLTERLVVGGRGPSGLSTRACVALVALLAMSALHPALWEVATRIEVYGLAGFLGLWSVARAAADLDTPRTPRRGLASGIALGLTASVNPVVAVIVASALTPGLVIALRRRSMRWTAVAWIVAGGLAGLVPYLYVPLVAGAAGEGTFVWGFPAGGEALARYATFGDFSHNQAASLAEVGHHGALWAAWATSAGLVPLLALGLASSLLLGHHLGLSRALVPLALGLALLFIWRNGVYYSDVTDYLGYLLIPLSMLGAAQSAMIFRVARLGDGRRGLVLAVAVAAALAVNTAAAPPTLLLGRTRHLDAVARTLAAGALEGAPEDAVVIVGSDHWVFPMMYLQEQEGLRTDVVVFARGLAGSSWFWQHVYERHPRLAEIELRGPGGQPARIRRFLGANPRPVLFEDWATAADLGARVHCAGPWLPGDRRACETFDEDEADLLTGAVEEQIDLVRLGSPGAAAVLSRVSEDRGLLHWRLGDGDEAVRALRAPVPRGSRPDERNAELGEVPPLSGAPLQLPHGDRAIGHFSRNLFIAAMLLDRVDHDAARRYLRAAVEAGLDESLLP